MNETSLDKRFYTVKEFHSLFDETITKSMIYKMIGTGKIPTRRIGNKILIPGDWVRAFFSEPYIAVEQVRDERQVS